MNSLAGMEDIIVHQATWRAIDTIAKRNGHSVSALAKLAGLDATAFNPSKRQDGKGNLRYPSMGSLGKVLAAVNMTMDDFTEIVMNRPDSLRATFMRRNNNTLHVMRDEPRVESTYILNDEQSAALNAAQLSNSVPLDVIGTHLDDHQVLRLKGLKRAPVDVLRISIDSVVGAPTADGLMALHGNVPAYRGMSSNTSTTVLYPVSSIKAFRKVTTLIRNARPGPDGEVPFIAVPDVTEIRPRVYRHAAATSDLIIF